MSYTPNTGPSHSHPSIVSDSMEGPPAYNASDDESGGFVQQTTTTITTTTTTNFFPGSRGRPNKTSRVENAATSAETIQEFPQTPREVQEIRLPNTLLIHKELPQLPEHKTGKTIRKGRPRTADVATTKAKDSAVGLTMPLALAHAAIGLRVPSVPPISPARPLEYFSGDEDRARPMTAPRHPVQEPLKVATRERPSLSSGIDAQSTAELVPTAPDLVHVGKDTTTRNAGKPEERTTSLLWNALPSVIPHATPKKSKTVQSGMPSTEPASSGKQITRRASWWTRRKPDTPLHTASSSISSVADFGRILDTTESPVVDLSYSPSPDASFTSRTNPSISSPVGLSINGQPSSPSQMRPQPSQEGMGLSSNNAPRGSSWRRPRSLSLFLKPPVSLATEIDRPNNSQLSPTSPTHHARQRAGQTPPLLRRLSTNLLSYSPYSSASSTPQSSLSISGNFQTKPSEEQAAAPVIPRPRIDEETPEGYVQRLVEAVTKAEVAMVLASR